MSDPQNQYNCSSTEKFRFIKASFEAPLNSASLWNLIWIFYPLRKFQGQRKIRMLFPKQLQGFRRKQSCLSGTSQVHRGQAERWASCPQNRRTGKIEDELQTQPRPCVLSRGKQRPWQLSAGGSQGNQSCRFHILFTYPLQGSRWVLHEPV